MAENFGVFIGVPRGRHTATPEEVAEIFERTDVDTITEEELAFLAGDDEDEEFDVEGLPPLDEAAVRAAMTKLGAELPAGEDEGNWLHGTVGYDFLLVRGEDSRLRMVDGSWFHVAPTGTRGSDVRGVLGGLHRLAEDVGAQFYQTSDAVWPELVGSDEIEWWVRATSDEP